MMMFGKWVMEDIGYCRSKTTVLWGGKGELGLCAATGLRELLREPDIIFVNFFCLGLQDYIDHTDHTLL
jgi:hypothetical protein